MQMKRPFADGELSRNFGTYEPTTKNKWMVLLQKTQELNIPAPANWIDKEKRVSINQNSLLIK